MVFDLYKPSEAVSLELKLEVLYYIASYYIATIKRHTAVECVQ